MEIGTIRAGDIVRCDVRGDMFYASVESSVTREPNQGRRVLTVSSLTGRPIPTRWITARQVIGHWRQRGARNKA